MGKYLDRFGSAVGQGMSTFLSTGNVVSTSGLDLMQVCCMLCQAPLGYTIG